MKIKSSHFAIFSLVLILALSACAQATTNSPAGAGVAATPAISVQATATPSGATIANTAAPASTQGVTNTGAISDPNGSMVFTIDPQKSQVDYRVREQLVSRNLPSDAIGKTSAVSGSIAIQPDGTLVASTSKITVDVTNLVSDQSMRDNFLRRSVLQTSQYPQVTFIPTQLAGLSQPLPQSGNISFTLTGNLTIQKTTKPVTWQVTGQIQNGVITVHITTNFKFEDFNLKQPKIGPVLIIEDNIILEGDLALQQSAK